MKRDQRLMVFFAGLIVLGLAFYFLNLPIWLLEVFEDVFVSFIIAGMLYTSLQSGESNRLEDYRLEFMTIMTLVVLVVYSLIM